MTENQTIEVMLIGISGLFIISSVETLSIRNIYHNSNLLGWQFLKQKSKVLHKSKISNFVNWIFDYPNFLIIIFIRLFLSIFLLILLIKALDFTSVVVMLFFVNVVFTVRNAYSNNGADQLSNLILMAIAFCCIAFNNRQIKILSIYFVALQVSTAYFISGFYKIRRKWLNGEYLNEVMSTQVFGNSYLFRLTFKQKKIAVFISISMISLEFLLAFAFLLPTDICKIVLLIGVLFHLGIAVIMGFNTFFITFLSTYPAIYYTALHGLSMPF
jgi:hypothetical protein